jgi:hypothetical protein
MDVIRKINGLGHYAKKIAKAVLKPVNTVLAVAVISAAMSIGEVQGQSREVLSDTIYATGMFQTLNEENNNFIGNVLLYLRPESMAIVVPDTTYEFITNNSGGVLFNNPGLPVYIDSITDIQEFLEKSISAFPNPGSEINVFLPEIEKGKIQFYNTLGQLVKEKEFDSDHAYLPLNDISAGSGVYKIVTENNKVLTGTYINQDGPTNGPASRPINMNSTFKEVQIYEATYWAKWFDPAGNFKTDSTLITLEEGDNGPINFFMTPDPIYVIDNQDLEGDIWKLENTSINLANAQVRATVNSTGDEYNTTSDANGHFIISGLPLGEEITFDVGGISDRYSFAGVNYTTPPEITNPADSVNSNFGAVLPLKIASSSALHIRDQTGHGTNQDTIWFYLGNSFNNTEKNSIRNNFINLQADENNVYIFSEKSTQSNIGINIEGGTYNTNPSEETINTPIGGILYPIRYANTTMSTGNYNIFVHEIKRALGFQEVAWAGVESVMETPVQNYTLEDKDIAQFVERPYWNTIYQEEKTWIDLNNIVEEIPSGKSTP